MKNKDIQFKILFGTNAGYNDAEVIGDVDYGDIGRCAYALYKRNRKLALALSVEIAREFTSDYWAEHTSYQQALEKRK